MESDIELAMRLQNEEDLTANDSLLASYLHEELNTSKTKSPNRIHSNRRVRIHSSGFPNFTIATMNHDPNESIDVDPMFNWMHDTDDDDDDHHHHHNHDGLHSHHHNNHHNHGHHLPMPNETQASAVRFNLHRHFSAPNSQSRLIISPPQSLNRNLHNFFNPRPIMGYPYRINRNRSTRNIGDLNNYEALLELGDSIGDAVSKGLNNHQLNQLPTNVYTTKQNVTNSPKAVTVRRDDSDNECLICISNFEQNDKLKTLPCLHKFHVHCIDLWLKQNAVCPVCRISILEQLG